METHQIFFHVQMSNERTAIVNALIVNEGRQYQGFVIVEGQFISAVVEGNPSQEILKGVNEIIDAKGMLLLPGAIDDQVHFRDPGLTHKADIDTESHAAIAGGVTSFMDMPNTKPPTVTIDDLKAKQKRAADVSIANYSFYIGATNDNLDTLLKVDYNEVPGVKIFLGSSTGNMLVDNEKTLDDIFSQVHALIAVHSEDEATIKANRERIVAEYNGDPAAVPITRHSDIRSRQACAISTRRAIDRAHKTGARLHVLHVSTLDEVEMMNPGDDVEHKKITAEGCVHHLWFTDAEYERLGTRIKWNPSVKTAADRDALRKAVVDGRIDIVATDHAPHLLSEKEGGALTAASGGPMVQYSVVTMLEMFPPTLVVDKMCHKPARLFGVDRRGFIRNGYYADLTLVETKVDYEVTDAMTISKCGWTPLIGTHLHNRIITTWVNGHKAFDRGTFSEKSAAMPLKFKK